MSAYDLILHNGLIMDGSGEASYHGDIGIRGGIITEIAAHIDGTAAKTIDCGELAVAPGFINLHSWAAQDLLKDGRAMSDVLQGVTLEVFGESWSEGPLSPEMKAFIKNLFNLPDIPWTSLSDFLSMLEAQVGVSVNVASYVGVDNLRYHTVGMDSRPASAAELDQMVALLEAEMRAGAVGVGSALIYVPGMFFQTRELRRLAEAAFQYGGAYISHIRSEGNTFHEALDEFIHISQGGRGILYHMKIQGEKNWSKLPDGLAQITSAQAAGTDIAACVYPYTAGMTSLTNVLPPWARSGDPAAMRQVLADPQQHDRLISEMCADQEDWENLYMLSGGARGVMILGLQDPQLARYNGCMLTDIADSENLTPEKTIIHLILTESSEPAAIFFNASEDNLRSIMQQPWVCLGSDVGCPSIDTGQITHPRAFGTFARFLGQYCRDLGLMPLQEGIRRLTSLPARLLGIDGQRGWLRPGYVADVTVFDPQSIQDHATYEQPLQYASGVQHVLVNGQLVVENCRHTGAKPGRFVRGPGYRPA
jgi:N-acyl-D-amino-acid deacylase